MTLKILRESIVEDPQEGFDAFSRAIGNVFEEYVNRLVNADRVALGGRYLPEFRYGPPGRKVDSPDAFILRPSQSLVFECKATRLPHEIDELLDDPDRHFLGWIRKVLGQTDDRPALEQGRTFFQQAPALPQLDNHDLADAIYLITVYPTVPPVLNSSRWREQWLFQRIPELRCELFSRVAFVSVGDLEVAVAAAQRPNNLGTVAQLIVDWWTVPDNVERRNRLEEAGLGDYVISEYPEVARREPELLRRARASLFEATEAAGFAESAWSMPKGLWDQPIVKVAQRR